MLSTIHARVSNFIVMILMGIGIGRLLAWLLPTHCLHSLENRPPLQRAFRQCVEHVQAMWSALPGHLLAFLVPTDCLRSLENWPSFHRAVRQSVGNAEAIGRLYDKPRQQPEGSYASFFTDLIRWAGRPFLSPLKQIPMATSKSAGADKIMNDPAFERTRENMSESGQAGKSASVVRDPNSYAKDAELQDTVQDNSLLNNSNKEARLYFSKDLLKWLACGGIFCILYLIVFFMHCQHLFKSSVSIKRSMGLGLPIQINTNQRPACI